jgi:hypothetical protein
LIVGQFYSIGDDPLVPARIPGSFVGYNFPFIFSKKQEKSVSILSVCMRRYVHEFDFFVMEFETDAFLLDCLSGDIGRVTERLCMGCSPNGMRAVGGLSALHYATMGGNIDVAQSLLSWGANIDDCDNRVSLSSRFPTKNL